MSVQVKFLVFMTLILVLTLGCSAVALAAGMTWTG
jgi:hypothetical protein